MKKIKKILAFVLSTSMLLGGMNIQAFAGEQKETNTANTELDNQNEYVVPLTFYGPSGKLLTEEPYSGTVQDYMDNVALVKKNDNGTYHVTLQIENYEKIDILQFSKPGVISDDIAPSNAPMGTFNIPEKYIANNEENPSEATEYLKEQGQINEEWNDKYIQNYSVEKATTGVSWYSFDVDTLEGTMYTKAFYSYGRTDDDLESYMYGIVNGKFTFDVNNTVVAKEINEENYKNIGLELSKVVTSVGDSPDFTGFVAEEKTANDLFSGTCEAKIENGKVTVTAETSSIDSIRVLEEIKDLGECTYPLTSSYRQYMYAYSREVKKNKYISVYSDNILEDGKFSIEYENLEEAIFGKQVEIQTEDGTYYGELRVRTTPKEKLELTDGDVTLVTDNYTVNSKAKFGAELLQETSDEDSEYNKYYSLLAGNASKALIYNLSLKMNDSQVIPSRAVELRVKIPKDWDTSKIEVQWYYPVNEMFNPIEYFDSSSYKNDDGSIHMEGDELVITGTTRVYNTIAITQKADKVDISEIQDGTYNVNVTMWQQDQPDRLSMSNSAVVNDSARLVVENGKKHIYFDTQGIVITGRYGYTNGIFWANNEQTEENGLPILSEYTPLDYYSYYLNDSGSTDMDSYAEEYDLYYPKSVGFEFPESADRDDGVYLNFFVPIMDELQHKVPGSGEGCRTAFMTLSGLTPVAEINEPTHDKSVLVVAVDKASKYTADNYTEESYKVLSDAVAKAQKVIDGTTSANDSEIVALDKEISDAISGLKEATGLDKYNKVLKNAKALNEADYTAESWADLQAVITAQEGKVTEENADQASADLQSAVDALVRLDDAVDKSELNGYIENALTKKNDGTYTDNSWNSFQAAIKSAQKVSADVNATKAEVEKQTKLLTSSYEALVVKNKQSDLFKDYPQIFEGTYSVPIKMLNATSDEDSMGNASMVQTGIVRVTGKGEVTLEMNFQSMQFAGMTGYLYKLKKVDMDTVEYNKYNYPVKYEASDATVLEEYTDVYDSFNNKNSEYYDKNTEGNWYPKKLSIPIELNDNLFYVEVYVPVMESIGEGQGTKVARVSIDWANIKQETGVERDNSVIEALLNQVSGMQQGDVADEYWNALNAAYMTAQDVYNDMNSTQKEIDLQVTALQAAVDAVETQIVDKTELNALIEKATAEANRTDVVYTSATLEALKTAITNAQAVAAKEDATKAEVQAQVTALQTALDSLRVVDKTNLNALIEKAKAEAAKTDVYESSSLTVLNTAITLAENVAANPKATESEVAAAEKSLTTALNGLVEKAVVDKSKLESKIAEAKTYLSQTDIYTESSLATLQSAVGRAQNVMDNDSASQKLVDDQVTKLTEAIQQLAKKSDGKLDIKNLADGVYSIYGTMVKVDKNTYSMSNEAINHTIKLTVKNGKYYITLNFNGLTVGQKLGYLSKLKYFTTGYTLDKYGNPQGTLADVTVDSYQKNSDGSLVSDQYGTNYPDEVTFELIPEALNDEYVPLQVFVPIMDAISSGTGTQPVYLKLDWRSLKATTSDNPDFDKNDNNSNNNNNNSNGSNNSSSLGNSSLGNNSLGSSSLGSSKLGSSSLGSGSSSLKSGTSSLGSGSSLKSASNVKTGDVVQNNTLWATILLLGGVALLAGIMEYNRKKKANVK